MKRVWLPVIAVIAWAALSGCAGGMDSLSAWVHSGPWWRAEQVDAISVRARDLETRGELGMALDHWRLVEDIAADPKEAQHEIHRLEEKIDACVRSHYQAGLAKVKDRRSTDARNHFLAALRLDPSFQPALRQIRARFSPFPFCVYRTAPGDRPASVAEKFFGDEEKAFLVAWFNHLPEDRALPPGSLLILPKWEDKGPPEIKEKPKSDPLALARDRLEAGDLQGALTLALEYFDHQRYRKARAVLEDMEEDHEAGVALKATVHARLEELAQVHYRNGVKHFINEDLKKAIVEWEIALDCDPNHAKARENIENARRLLEKIIVVMQLWG